MEAFDIVIMVVGAILLLSGLFLFVSGKRNEDSQSHVEGFGVKLNISNPSVLLIVFGAGLMLVPRLFPNPQSLQQLPTSIEPKSEPKIEPQIPPLQVQQDLNVGNSTGQKQPAQEKAQPQATYSPPPSEPTVQAFMPSGYWQLADYEENGINLSSNIRGEIQFQPQSSTQTNWQANYQVSDIWGNASFVQYSGSIMVNSGMYQLIITQSTDPAFTGQTSTSLDMKMEGNNRLHMGYLLNGSNTVAHWMQ